MIEKNNVQLRGVNTLRLSALAKKYYEVKDEEELKLIFSDKISALDEFRILGGGSNLWLSSEIIANVIKMNNLGVQVTKTEDRTFVRVKAGEEWSKLVEFLVKNGIGGLENLIDIPGSVGAAPVQNIGAYGTEVGYFIREVKAFDIKSKKIVSIAHDKCNFSYRDSLFKKDRNLIIVEVFFEFNNNYKPEVKNKEILSELGSRDVNIENILLSVRNIRERKIPNIKRFPNSGSFFKNPIVNESLLRSIRYVNEDVVCYKVDRGYKLSAAWLIEKSGWKGNLIDGIGMSPMHSLIFINTSKSINVSIDDYINNLKLDVYKKFKVELEVEPVRW